MNLLNEAALQHINDDVMLIQFWQSELGQAKESYGWICPVSGC